MKYIIVLTIGPVQGYISQARRTQDLWQGSRILSYLASAGVAHVIDHEPHATVIYPDIKAGQTDNIPNRMVILWDGESVSDAQHCAEQMKSAIEDTWRQVSQNVFNYVGITTATVREIWKRQQESWLECYWVVVQYDDGKSYAENIQAANAAMGSRKLLRNYPAIAEEGRKCSITGEHEALHESGDYVAFWDNLRNDQRNLSLLGKHERLSAISTIKRLAHEPKAKNPALVFPNRFPSTSSIAVAPFRYDVLKALDDEQDGSSILRQRLQTFIDALLVFFDDADMLFFTKKGENNPEHFGLIEETISSKTLEDDLIIQFRSIDGDFLFEDTLIVKTIEEYLPPIKSMNQKDQQRLENERRNQLKPLIANAKSALQDLLRTAKNYEIKPPQPYLVILSMDGDQMGKTLGQLADARQHQMFSHTLARFAREDVKQIVEDKRLGRLVYAGGDDVLALLPVRDALDAAEELRAAFEECVAKTGIKNPQGNPVTASTGLAYIHHTHNLQDAVRTANDAQHVAKEYYNRNAVSVRLLRRSGEAHAMGQRWVLPDGITLETALRQLTDAFGNGLSHNLPQDLAQIAYSMSEGVPEAAVEAELRRVLKRRLDEDSRGRADDLAQTILRLKALYSWENVQHWVELTRFIAQKEG